MVSAVLALVLLAGCTAERGSLPAGGPSPSASAQDRPGVAYADATALLATFRPPPGATRLPGQPPGTPLLSQAMPLDSPNVATVTSWWQVSGEPHAVLASLATPAGASRGNSSSRFGPEDSMEVATFDWPPGNGFAGRHLIVMATLTGTATVLRVDGMTVWVPDRGPATLVPDTARSVVVSVRPGPSSLLTIDDPAQVTAIVAAVNALQIDPYGPRPCPLPPVVEDVDLSFRSAAGTEVAQAQASTGGCDDVYLTIGTTKVTLTGGRTLIGSVQTPHLSPAPSG
jgi:hypothetical protein